MRGGGGLGRRGRIARDAPTGKDSRRGRPTVHMRHRDPEPMTDVHRRLFARFSATAIVSTEPIAADGSQRRMVRLRGAGGFFSGPRAPWHSSCFFIGNGSQRRLPH